MQTLLAYLDKGGPLMWVLLAFSIVGAAVILERAAVYLGYGFSNDRWFASLLSLVEQGKTAEALAEARRERHPVARVVEAYLENLARPAKVRIDNVKRAGALALEGVEKRLRVLAAISHLAPLVGLLGTVTGMVVSFDMLAAGKSEPADLAGGIGEAMITTAGGLFVGIPAMFLYFYFRNLLQINIANIQKRATFMLDLLSGEIKIEGSTAEFEQPAE